ncbi:MAG: Protein translocase subunit SecY [Chlamydiae bacterium]|nr:Protein translocase subunit SecY [Chlamydiota bacterium]
MKNAILRILGIPNLKKKIFWTLLLLGISRIGVFVPVPGINGELAVDIFKHTTKGAQSLFQLINIFSGGAFSQMTIFALGVMPYISASIVLQVLVALVPRLQKEVKENPEVGRRKILKWTRLLTIGIAFLQSFLYCSYTLSRIGAYPGVILPEMLVLTWGQFPWVFYLITTITMTAGTVFLMWIGEQITEKGIGNGVSLIISIGIVSTLPFTIGSLISALQLESQEPGSMTFISLIVLIALFVIIVIGTIMIVQGERRIPLQYARRIVGMREMQASGSPYLPLKVNYAGVIPVIFASSFLMLPASIVSFLAKSQWAQSLATMLSPGSWLYTLLYVGMIFFFTYFWTATQFHPGQIASDMKRNGAFIPGIKQGASTENFLKKSMNRITLLGAVSLVVIALLPSVVGKLLGLDQRTSNFFGGTSLLILVGVALDTYRQIDSHLLTKRYDGALRRGRAKLR